MAGSTKTGVDLNISAEARKKITEMAEANREKTLEITRARKIRKQERRLQRRLPSDGPECRRGYVDKESCVATGVKYDGADKCQLCKEGGKR